jgi:hypothetical protein
VVVVVVEPASHHGPVLKEVHVKWEMCYSYSLQNPHVAPFKRGFVGLVEGSNLGPLPSQTQPIPLQFLFSHNYPLLLSLIIPY